MPFSLVSRFHRSPYLFTALACALACALAGTFAAALAACGGAPSRGASLPAPEYEEPAVATPSSQAAAAPETPASQASADAGAHD